MVASIGAVASSPSQGVSYYERDGYYAKDDPAHKDASAWNGKGAGALGLSGAVEADRFKEILEGQIPDGSGRRLGRKGKDGSLSSPSRTGRHAVGPEIGLSGGADRRRRAHRRGPRPRREAYARLDGKECSSRPG